MARAPGALLKGPTTRPLLQQLRDRALVPIHPNAWKMNSANFAHIAFSEVELPVYEVLRSSRKFATSLGRWHHVAVERGHP